MSKKNFIEACKYSVDYTAAASRTELNLFCDIMGYPKSEVNSFIGDDPHGIADIMEGYRIFNMTDIHVVISEYDRWMKIYKTHCELRKEVDAWYFYCEEWHEKNSLEEPRWVSVKERLPEEDGKTRTSVVVEVYTCGRTTTAWYDFDSKLWHLFIGFVNPEEQDDVLCDVSHWKPIITPEQEAERSKGCPNLRSWLAGCPVDGLRDATLEWHTQRETDLQAAHQRVEECKQALEDAIKEEVKLNNGQTK